MCNQIAKPEKAQEEKSISRIYEKKKKEWVSYGFR